MQVRAADVKKPELAAKPAPRPELKKPELAAKPVPLPPTPKKLFDVDLPSGPPPSPTAPASANK